MLNNMDKMFIDIDFNNIKIKSQILIIGNVEKNILKKLVEEYKCLLYGIGDKDLDNNYFKEYIKTDLNCLKISNYQNIVDKKFDYIILIDKLIFDLHNITTTYCIINAIYIINPKYIARTISPFIFSDLFDFSGTPNAIEARTPPISPPI